MPKLSEAELLARDAQRDLNAELLESAAQLHAGKLGRVSVVTRDGRVIDSPVTKARLSTRMSNPNSLPCWGFQSAPCKTGSKGGASRAVQPKPCCG